MRYLRFLLFPFALVYGLVVLMRNGMYRMKWFRSTKFSVPTINVGNLSMGGTGKTPHVEYLVRLLKQDFKVVTLSRGFGRKTQGFILADEHDSALTIGDEPYQYYNKFKEDVHVAVDEKRVLGVVDIIRNLPETNVILLDDAFQHRSITPGLNILLTTYNEPFSNDFMLPVGNLREFKSGKNRADIVVVTKCPKLDIDEIEWRKKLGLKTTVPLFFSEIRYGELIPLTEVQRIFKKVILVTGIAKSMPFVQELEKEYEIVHHFNFKDHHKFTVKDIEAIHNIFGKFAGDENLAIVTTEKDAMRLLDKELFEAISEFPWYYQEIEVAINKKDEFKQLIKDYVQKIN